MLQHTGEWWTYLRTPRDGRVVITGTGKPLAELRNGSTHADGHLMAAGPLLLATARKAVVTGDLGELARFIETLDALANTV